jgi:hypothetical protein
MPAAEEPIKDLRTKNRSVPVTSQSMIFSLVNLRPHEERDGCGL